MKKILGNMTALLVAALVLVNLAACGSVPNSKASDSGAEAKADTKAELKKEPVTIKIAAFTVGTDGAAPFFKKMVDGFPKSKLGEGVTVEVEEIPGADAFNQKIKLMIASGDLPDIVQNAGVNTLDIANKSGKIADLTPYFDSDKEWKGLFDPKSLVFNSRDGKILAVPFTKEVCNIYYNKELFQKAGIGNLPTTWEEFWKVCDKLKAAGITPVGMDSEDFGWLTSMFLCAMVGTDGAEGNKWMNSQLPRDYNTPEFINALKNIRKMYKNYTTKDALGGKYDTASGHFFKGDVAMIANGPWMIPNFKDKTLAPEGFYDKVGAMAFPQSSIVMVPMFGEMVGNNGKAKIDAAVNYQKFKTSPENQIEYLRSSGNFFASPKIKVPDDIIKNDHLLGSVIDLTSKARLSFGENQAYWYPNTLDTLTSLLPQLAFDKITAEDFAKKMTETAQKNK